MSSEARVVDTAEELDFDPRACPPMPPRTAIVMADPAYFDIEYVINPYMEGHEHDIDSSRARLQWETLAQVYRHLGFEVKVVPPAPDMPDLVFAANQSFPGRRPDGRLVLLVSRMATPQRQPEEAWFERWFHEQGFQTARLPGLEVPYEGMGDAEWLPGRSVVFAGHGFRSDPQAWEALARFLEVPVLRFRLVDERFYHLDTCLQLLAEDRGLYVAEAFDPPSRALLEAAVPHLLPVPLWEAVGGASCNGHCPDGVHYVVQKGNPRTCALVRDLGFDPIEVDTSEFMKSGGSVYCMKLHLV